MNNVEIVKKSFNLPKVADDFLVFLCELTGKSYTTLLNAILMESIRQIFESGALKKLCLDKLREEKDREDIKRVLVVLKENDEERKNHSPLQPENRLDIFGGKNIDKMVEEIMSKSKETEKRIQDNINNND